MTLDEVKKHLRVLDDFEDEMIQEYLDWAVSKVKSAITRNTEHNDFFEGNRHYNRAVAMLTAHYYENRLPVVEKNSHSLTFGVRDAITHLKADYLHYVRAMSEPYDDE